MNLHENKELFEDAVIATSQHIGINPLYVEKDYWITRALKLLSEADKDHKAIFKGGTSLSKAHFIGYRFSEDIDIAISNADILSGNQRKTLIKKLAKAMTDGLDEIPTHGVTSKGSSYYRAIYGYEQIPALQISMPATAMPVRIGQLMIEINSFANPYPFEDCEIDNFIRIFLQATANDAMIRDYGMETFHINVLDKKRTAIEKLVSLFRFSLSVNYEEELIRKIRHFYDLYYLLQDMETQFYFDSPMFIEDLKSLLYHDRTIFDKPDGWNHKKLSTSPLLIRWSELWDRTLSRPYMSELSDLAYRPIPEADQVCRAISFLLEKIQQYEIK